MELLCIAIILISTSLVSIISYRRGYKAGYDSGYSVGYDDGERTGYKTGVKYMQRLN